MIRPTAEGRGSDDSLLDAGIIVVLGGVLVLAVPKRLKASARMAVTIDAPSST